MTSLDDMAAGIAACIRCPALVASRTHTVPGEFPNGAELLLVGEGPGAHEDLAGRPFVGRSGALLDSLLLEVRMPRQEVAVANVVKCRPPQNRAPTRVEVDNCRPWLDQQLSRSAPRVVVAMGSTAVAWFFGRNSRISDLRGAAHQVDGRHVVATYHPSAALRFGPKGAPRAALHDDLALAVSLCRRT
ncbi:MAG: uracil-DNA glycosylase [Candidatus Nanopelagicales bacterium]